MRQEIVDALESAGPCSIAALARIVGRAPDSLYFHVRELERVGLVRVSGVRKQGRHASALYDLTVRPLTIDRDAPVVRPLLGRIGAAAVRLALRDFHRAISRPAALPATLGAGRARGWLSPRDARRLESRLVEILDLVRGSRPGVGRVPFSFSWIVSPAPPGRSTRKPRTPDGD